jgi:cystathionine gamma-synthase
MVAALETPHFGPIPPYTRHAITIHLPGWAMLLRFIEGDMSLIQQFKSFYPRLKLHADVLAVINPTFPASGLLPIL